MSELPLLSSKEIIRALKRAGFKPARKSNGSHQAFVKEIKEKKSKSTSFLLQFSTVARQNIGKIWGMGKRNNCFQGHSGLKREVNI